MAERNSLYYHRLLQLTVSFLARCKELLGYGIKIKMDAEKECQVKLFTQSLQGG